MKDYSLFNKLILHTVSAYLDRAYEEGMTKEPMHIKLMSGLRSFQTFGKFLPEEAKLLQSLGDNPILEKIKNREVSFVVYSLELMRLWVQTVPLSARKHIYLGVSNKKLLLGRAYFTTMMLSMKQKDPETYKEKRAIIDESVLNAKHYFSFMMEQLIKEKEVV